MQLLKADTSVRSLCLTLIIIVINIVFVAQEVYNEVYNQLKFSNVIDSNFDKILKFISYKD